MFRSRAYWGKAGQSESRSRFERLLRKARTLRAVGVDPKLIRADTLDWRPVVVRPLRACAGFCSRVSSTLERRDSFFWLSLSLLNPLCETMHRAGRESYARLRKLIVFRWSRVNTFTIFAHRKKKVTPTFWSRVGPDLVSRPSNEQLPKSIFLLHLKRAWLA